MKTDLALIGALTALLALASVCVLLFWGPVAVVLSVYFFGLGLLVLAAGEE